ncbi:MAG TPA: AAA family ATPase [Actinomycetota bacterium]|nr:AAA family ATPase [Actinomycetota bacterium]
MGAPSTNVFGRNDELEVVGVFLDALPEGPSALVFTGAPGAGKTTLWNAGAAAARARGSTVLVAQPVESETTLSFAALGDLLGRLVDEVDAGLPPPQARALDVALLRVDPGEVPPDSRAVSLAVLAMLRFVAASGPVVIAVDDVQWLDASTARVLEFAFRRLESEPVGVLATIRAEDDAPAPLGLDRAIPDHRRFRQGVGPLDPAALGSVLRDRLGAEFRLPTVQRIHEASGGNPFYALEIARALLRGDEPAPGQPLPVPGTLLGLLRGRVAAVPEDERDTLLVLAAMSSATVAALESASDARGPAGMLPHAVGAGLVEIDGERVRFSHPVFCSAILADAAPGRLRDVHRLLAGVATDAEERARHLALAADGPDPAVASALDEGARAARSRGAPDAAAELCEMAVRMSPAERFAERMERTLEAAKHHVAAGDSPHGRTLVERAVEEAPPGPLRARAFLFLGLTGSNTGSWNRARELHARALDEAGADPGLRGRIEQAMGYAELFTGRLPAALVHARTALELAEAGGDPDLISEALQFLAFCEFALGRGFRRDLLERALELERVSEDHWVLDLIRPSYVLGQLLKYTDELDESRSVFQAMLAQAVERGREAPIPAIHYHLAELECWAGRWGAARDHARRSLEGTIQIGETAHYRTLGLYAQALVDAQSGRAEEARAAATEGMAIAERMAHVIAGVLHLSVLGFLDLFEGNLAGASSHLATASDMAESMGVEEPALFRFVPDQVEALVALGDLDGAEAVLDRFEERAARLDRAWALATGARCRGLLLAARGDMEGALESLRVALAHHERVPEPFALARTLYCQGQVLRRAKLKAESRAAFERALAIYAELGARPWAEQASREARRGAVRTAGPFDLTPTEERVAALVAEGRTNREAADALFMSVNTIEWNLSRIYRKLGVRSRTELAAKLREGS